MQKVKINVMTEFDKNSNLEINEYLNNLKESFENVIIISIESLPIEYNKSYNYEYRVKFYHDLFLIC
jgi:hypothetical protein